MFVGCQQGSTFRPVEGHAVLDDVALFGVMYGGRERGVDALSAVILEQPAPGVDRARHGDRVRTGLRQFVDAPCPDTTQPSLLPVRGRSR